ncbi:MAG: hypothetical protein ACXABY_18550, partial [Candidatus Thorarchaeota archaeon]
MLKTLYLMEKIAGYDIDRCFLCGYIMEPYWVRLGWCDLDGRYRSVCMDHEGTDAYYKLTEEIMRIWNEDSPR